MAQLPLNLKSVSPAPVAIMNDKLKQTMKILHSPKVTTDDRGRTVWADTVRTAKLELMSTQMLQAVIASGDATTSARLRQVAEADDGLVARDLDTNRFEVITDDELQRILDGTDTDSVTAGTDRVAEAPATLSDDAELELVSTQMLRVMLKIEDDEPAAADEPADAGFDPYNSG